MLVSGSPTDRDLHSHFAQNTEHSRAAVVSPTAVAVPIVVVVVVAAVGVTLGIMWYRRRGKKDGMTEQLVADGPPHGHVVLGKDSVRFETSPAGTRDSPTEYDNPMYSAENPPVDVTNDNSDHTYLVIQDSNTSDA